MEIEFNELFDAYRELYFEGGTSSVYLWDLDHGFAACFLIKKSTHAKFCCPVCSIADITFLVDVEGDRYVKSGCWDSIHVVEAVENNSKSSATYKLTTTIMLSMSVEKQEVGETLLSGSLTRQVRFELVYMRKFHILCTIRRS